MTEIRWGKQDFVEWKLEIHGQLKMIAHHAWVNVKGTAYNFTFGQNKTNLE